MAMNLMALPGGSATGGTGGGGFGGKTPTLQPGGGTWRSYRNSRGKRVWWIPLIPMLMEMLKWRT